MLDEGTEIRAVANAEAAEMTKLAETTYRDVNIAYANELARFAARNGIDVTEVIEAANSQPYSHIHQPGVGVGGHCIPVYPHFLFNARSRAATPAAGPRDQRGDGQPSRWTSSRIASARWMGRRCSCLGVAYRGDVREDAFSSAFRLRDELLAAGARVYGHDPYYDADHLRSLRFEPYDLDAPEPIRVAVLQAAHRAYLAMTPDAIPGLELFVDGRNAIDREPYELAGIGYVGIGR